MTKEKSFDAVQMMRSIREQIQKEWETNPQKVEERLKEIRKQFNIKQSAEAGQPAAPAR